MPTMQGNELNIESFTILRPPILYRTNNLKYFPTLIVIGLYAINKVIARSVLLPLLPISHSYIIFVWIMSSNL